MADIIFKTTPDELLTGDRMKAPKIPKEFQWDDRPRKLQDVVAHCRFPFIAKLHSGAIAEYATNWNNVDEEEETDETLLQVMEVRRKKAVVVRKMQWDRKTGDYATCGKQVDIPASYKGWFEVLPEDGRPVEYFDSIQAITNVKPRRFLVRTSTVGYQLSVENGTSSWVPYEVKPGTVLTTGIVFMDQKKTKSNVKNFFRKILRPSKVSKKDQDLKYLQCFDGPGVEVMIPLIMSGVFSPVGETAEENFDSVYELQDLILAFNLPVKVQLIHEAEQENRHIVPHGIVKLEEVKDYEFVEFGRYPLGNGNDEMFEVPVDADITVRKDVSRRRKTRRKSQPITEPSTSYNDEAAYMNHESLEVELPTRVKEAKKNKTTGIFDKISLRSRTRKERASLKSMQENGVFSSRLSKADISFDDVIKPAEEEDVVQDSNERDKGDLPQRRTSDNSDNTEENENRISYGLLKPIGITQGRDLPPIPGSNDNQKQYTHSSEKDGLYEELPVAPKPPSKHGDTMLYRATGENDTGSADEDGYMSPAQLRLQTLNLERENIIKKKPPRGPGSRESSKASRSRKTRSEVPSNYDYYRQNSENEIDSLFRASTENIQRFQPEDSPYNSRQTYHTTVNAQTSQDIEPSTFSYESAMKFVDDTNLNFNSEGVWTKAKSRSQRNLNIGTHATVRSHNARSMRNAIDVFNFGGSFSDIGQSHNNESNNSTNGQVTSSGDRPGYNNPYGRSSAYCESEPGPYRRYYRSSSVTGLSEQLSSFKPQADDSAISGDYGYHGGDSEYSYNEYADYRDDNWVPPDDLSGLTVQEVSKSLHYIGMKDRVVIRLANEQIDGDLLCTLDKELLRDGFPELNGLDIKKIVDFIQGWRPKKK